MFLHRRSRFESDNCFLCMRRDVSEGLVKQLTGGGFSLHAQRCFLSDTVEVDFGSVFSACAEMFLRLCLLLKRGGCFLCMRRDVSLIS